MAWMHIQLDSAALRMPACVEVLLPQNRVEVLKKGERIPVLYLLHDEGGDHTEWLRKAPLETYQQEYEVAIVLPSGDNSYFMNMKYGRNYRNYLIEELPKRIYSLFPVSKEKGEMFLAGAGIGGYAALSIAISPDCPFQAVGAFSPNIAIDTAYQKNPHRMESIFGSYEEYKHSNYSLENGIESWKEKKWEIPFIYQLCSKKDVLYDRNHMLYEFMKKRGIHTEFLSTEKSPGWYFYNDCLYRFLKIITSLSKV